MSNAEHWCFAWLATADSSTGATRGMAIRGARWLPGEVVSVAFLDDDWGLAPRVRAAAERWTGEGMANLVLDFRTDPREALIRISFRYRGSWSVIGTTCRELMDPRQPTMNYGWLRPGSTDEEVERVVLHEFGHALGLGHEHQNPTAVIPWNREQVINDLSGFPHYWSLEQIERNLFRPYTMAEVVASELDPGSIMMYPIPARWTTNGFSVGLNRGLSDEDRRFIRDQYPR